MTTSDILKRLQAISKKHPTSQPKLALDSLLLALQVNRAELTPHLEELQKKGLIQFEGNSITITDNGINALA